MAIVTLTLKAPILNGIYGPVHENLLLITLLSSHCSSAQLCQSLGCLHTQTMDVIDDTKQKKNSTLDKQRICVNTQLKSSKKQLK